MMNRLTLVVVALLSLAEAFVPRSRPYASVANQKRAVVNSSLVDLGYAIYQGVGNSTNGINTWFGLVDHA